MGMESNLMLMEYRTKKFQTLSWKLFIKGISSEPRENEIPRTVYEVIYYGEHHRVAVQVGTNGYVVSANPKSMEEFNLNMDAGRYKYG